MTAVIPGREATRRFGWWYGHRYLLSRRLSQLVVMSLFLLGPWAGVWILHGNLSSSRLFDTVPMTDPLTFLQTLVAGHMPEMTLISGVTYHACSGTEGAGNRFRGVLGGDVGSVGRCGG